MQKEATSSKSTLWLIPARGGSKGIPDKNLKPFCGRSLVGRAVYQALECAKEDDIVFVSTDSERIREEAERHSIEIPFLRPADLASDNSGTYPVILHCLEEFGKMGKQFEKVVLLQPTSPLRSIEDIKKTCDLWHPEIDMVVSVCESKSNPYYNLFETDKEGFLKISKGNGKIVRRQEAPKVWEYNGAVYVMTTNSLKKGAMSEFERILPYEMPRSRSLDLDTPEDWMLAELVFKKMEEK